MKAHTFFFTQGSYCQCASVEEAEERLENSGKPGEIITFYADKEEIALKHAKNFYEAFWATNL